MLAERGGRGAAESSAACHDRRFRQAGLAEVWRDGFNRTGKGAVQVWVDRAMFDFCASGIYGEIIITLPVIARADGAGAKAAAAIWANVFEDFFNAGPAESAFEAADHGFDGIRWERFVAVFAGGSEFEHRIAGDFIATEFRNGNRIF